MRGLLPLAALAALAATAALAAIIVLGDNDASTGPAAQTPEAFMARVLRLTTEGRYGDAWSILHPGHQRLAPREQFVRCRATDPAIAGYRFVSARFVSKRYIRIDSPGIPQHTSTQVVLRFRIADDSGGTSPASDATVRAVWIDTRWAWVLPDREIPAFRAGRCPV